MQVPGLGGTESVSAACDAGEKAISAASNYGAAPASLLSQVTRTAESAFSTSGLNLLPTPQTLSLSVVCAKVAG